MSLPDIIIPPGKIKVLRDGVVVVSVEPAHHVGRDELACIGMRTNRLNLISLIATPCVAHEPLPAEQEPWISVFGFDWNLVPGRVTFAPVSGRPTRVQRIQRPVARL